MALFGQVGWGYVFIIAILTSILLIIIGLIFSFLKKPFNKNIIVFSFVSFGFIYGTGTSGGISEAGTFIGFCLFVCLLLRYKMFFNIGKIVIILFCISFSLMWIETKYEQPYFWWYVTSPDVRATLFTPKTVPIMQGLYTSGINSEIVEQVSDEIDKGSKPGDSVLLFPNIPIFYLTADRKPPGKALVYWFDFLPDNLAIKEAEAIRKNPPKVIVYLDLGQSVWKEHELLFRGGKPSGQRKIVEAFMSVIKTQKMHVVKQYTLPHDVHLTVWRK
jgi:hypothetical protein